MSVIFYKFKSAKDYDKLIFDGSSVSVFELKREIILSKDFGGGADFDLVVYNAQSLEEYKDDSQIIPRNTSVLVSRRPPVIPTKGTVRRYLASVVPREVRPVCPPQYYASVGASAPRPPGPPEEPNKSSSVCAIDFKNPASPTDIGGATELHLAKSPHGSGDTDHAPVIEGVTEEERIDNMFKQQARQWKNSQRVSQQKIPIKPRRQAPNRSINNCSLTPANAGDPSYARNSFNLISNSVPSDMGGPNPASSGILGDVERARSNGSGNNTWADPRRACQRAPPPGYICYRCGRKGHFISDCPTIGDKDFDKPRLKRTTGIPKIFLKTVENTQSSRSGVMIAQTGELVIAQPNDFEWQKLYTKTKNSLGPGNIYELVEKDSPSEYRCGICERLCRDPVSTSCCDTNFCYECINARLLDSEDREERLRCPRCSRNQAPEDLVPRNDIQTAIESLLRDFVLKQNNGEKVQAENDSAPGTDATSRSAMKPPINGTRCVEEGAEMEVCANPNDADSSNPAPRTATGNFHHYAVPRRKRVSKPFTFISLSQVSNAEGAQDTVEVSQPATDTNGEHAGYISKSTTQMRSGFSSNPHFRNRSKLSTKPFTVISPESGSSVKKDKGSTNIATNGRLGPDFAGDKPSAAIISWGPNRQTTGAISRKRRNYSKTAGEDTISRAVSSNVSGRERNQIQVHPNSVSSVTARSSSTDLTEDPLTDEPADRSDTPQTVSNVYSPPGEYHRAGSKRGKLLGGEFNEAESGSNDTRLPPGDEDNTGPLEGENQPINQSASTSQDTEGKILVKLSGSQPLPGAPPTLLQEPIHLYKPGRNRVVSQRGDLPPNMPQSALISTIPLSSREFPSSSYSPRPAAPSFFTASDVGPQGVRSFDPIHLQSSPYDMFIPGPPLVNNVPLDSGPRPAGAPQARYRFAPNANVR